MFMVNHLIGFGAGGVSDPYFSSVVLLMHLEGADASTTFTDVKGHSFTARSNAQLDTAQKKFGVSSLLTDGSDDSITTAGSADWNFSTGDFTIEAFVRFASLASIQNIFSWGNRPGASTGANLYYDTTNGLFFVNEATISFSQGATTGWSTDTWYHIAVDRSGTSFRMYRDGSVLASHTDADSMFTTSEALDIGGWWNGSAVQQSLNGWVDEVRITKGVARYAGAFSVPTEAYPDS